MRMQEPRSMNMALFVVSILMWPGRFGFCCALVMCASFLIKLPSTQFFVKDQIFLPQFA